MRAAISAGIMAAVVLWQPLGAQAPAKPVAPVSLAEVNGVAITVDEVNKTIGPQIAKLEEQIYQLQQQRVEALISEKLLAGEAAKRGISPQALLDAEVTSKVSLVTEQEIETFYQKNKAQFGNAEESAAKDQTRTRLQNEKLAARRQAFLQSLRAQATVAVHLIPPPVYRAQVSLEGARVRGPSTAPVTIVEYSDFHCPFCKGVEQTLSHLLSRYGDKVRLAFKDFPIDSLHPQSRAAHEAARCAGDQGKFWEYHQVLFAGTPKTTDQLKGVAQQVGLDVAKFDQCVAAGKYKAAVQKEIDEGRRLGVTGTPGFFINGRLLSGAQPLDTFARLIDDELSRAAQQPAAAR